MKDLLVFGVYVLSGAAAIPLIYFKQRRYLTDHQPIACLLCGPIALVLAIFCPASFFTSKDQAEGE